MGNCVIGFNNHLDSTFYDVVYSKGDWALPLENLSDRFFVNVAQSEDATLASTKGEIWFGTSRVIKIISVPNHTIERQGRIRHRISSYPAFSQVTLKDSALAGDDFITVQAPENHNCAFKIGDKFRIAGDDTEYTITMTRGVSGIDFAGDYFLGQNYITNGETLGSHATDNATIPTDPETDGPDWTVSGFRMTEGTDSAANHILNISSFGEPVYHGTNLCASIYAKAGQRSKCRLEYRANDESFTQFSAWIDVDLSTGEIIEQYLEPGAPHVIVNAGIYPVGGGWYRIFITTFCSIEYIFSKPMKFWILDDEGNDTYDGTGSKFLYVAKPVIENENSIPSRYAASVFNDEPPAECGLTFEPVLAANASAGAALTACNGDMYSFQPVDFVDWTDVWNDAFRFGTLPFGHPSFFDLKIDPERAVNYSFPYVKVYDDKIVGEFMEWQIDDSTNSAGTVSIGRMWISDGWEPSYTLNYGASLGVETLTEVSSGITGTDFYNEISKGRNLRGTIDLIPEDEALEFPFEIMLDSGISKQIFFVFDKTDTIHRHRRSFLATFRTLNPLEYPYPLVNGVPVEIKEVTA